MSSVTVLYDDNSPSFDYTSAHSQSLWSTSNSTRWVGGSSTWFSEEGDESSATGEFTFKFNGKGLKLYGSVPESVLSRSVTVQLNDQPPFRTPLRDETPFRNGPYRSWLKIDQIDGAGEHTLRIADIPPGLSVDFATVQARPDDTVLGHTCITDDPDPIALYFGPWQTGHWSDRNPYEGNGMPIPYMHTTHTSLSSDAAALIQFTGTSFSVMGFKNLTAPLALNFTLDNGEPETVVFEPDDPSLPPSFNHIWWSRDGLSTFRDNSTEVHELLIGYASESDQSFSIDYMLYKPAFTLASDQPELTWNGQKTGNANTIGIGVGTTIGLFLLALLILICYKRFIHSDFMVALRTRSQGRMLDLSFELGPLIPIFTPGRAPPNAFTVPAPPPKAKPNLTADPFVIPAAEWAASAHTPRSTAPKPGAYPHDRKVQFDTPESCSDSVTPQRTGLLPSHGATQHPNVEELIRAVQILSAELDARRENHAERFTVQLVTGNSDVLQPPPYTESLSYHTEDDEYSPTDTRRSHGPSTMNSTARLVRTPTSYTSHAPTERSMPPSPSQPPLPRIPPEIYRKGRSSRR